MEEALMAIEKGRQAEACPTSVGAGDAFVHGRDPDNTRKRAQAKACGTGA